MKKYVILFSIFILVFILLNVKETYSYPDNMEKKININSNEIVNYIKKNNINNIKKICTINFCDYIRSNHIEKSIEIFKEKYKNYLLSQTSEEVAISTIIKGFPIIKLELF